MKIVYILRKRVKYEENRKKFKKIMKLGVEK